MDKVDRIIGMYKGHRPGPLFICFGAMHGNEPAGVKAIELVIKMLEVEPIRHPKFEYVGNFVGIIGNLEAYRQGKRFIDKDLNRNFSLSRINELRAGTIPNPTSEDREMLEIDDTVRLLIDRYDHSEVFLLDLHTTSSYGGIFTICRDIDNDIRLGLSMHAPIVLGMLEGLKGTTLHYFTTENMGVKTTPITFESGQHEEELSVPRAVAAIINFMKEMGSVAPNLVENHHEKILIRYSADLPKVTRLIERYAITNEDGFVMNPGYTNFQKVYQGEQVAEDKNGEVTISEEGRLLMPLYQQQGDEGYFLVKDIQLEQ